MEDLSYRTRIIDEKIAQRVQDVCNNIQRALKTDGLDIISKTDKDTMIEAVSLKSKFIQDLFKEGFVENEEELRLRYMNKKEKEKPGINNLVNIMMKKKIDEELEKMTEQYENPLEKTTIIERKLFLDKLLDVLGNEKFKDVKYWDGER